MKVKLFFRKDSRGNTIIFGKALGELSKESEVIFEGEITEDLLLVGKKRKPRKFTECYSNGYLMSELGKL